MVEDGEAKPEIIIPRVSFEDSAPRETGQSGSERSPLLEPSQNEVSSINTTSTGDNDTWIDSREGSKSSWYLILLTLGGLGLQVGWSVETSNGSPYLLSLGLSKAMLALVWIAGPLSGVLVQPYVGIKSDRCRSPYGKRRPFIIGGCVATILSLMVLAWTQELVGGFLSIFGADPASPGVKKCVMLFAVLFVYILDFAINVLQAAVRAFVVDCAPTHQQDLANAWVSRTSGVGNIMCYVLGFMNLPAAFPWLGYSQFKVLCALASFIIALTVGVSCTVQERDPRIEGAPLDQDTGVMAVFKDLFRSVRRLPPQFKTVCGVQFLAWVGWFPFLFYTTTYIGEIYTEPFFQSNPNMNEAEVDELWETATRQGTFSLLIFAITTLAASVFLPFIVTPSFQPSTPSPSTHMTPSASWSRSQDEDYFPKSSKLTPIQRLRGVVSGILSRLQIESLTLRRLWLLSHIMFAVLMFLTFLARSVAAGTVIVGLIGIPWAVTQWAPFALISAEISKRDAIRRGIIKPPPTRDAQQLAAGEDDSRGADQAGVVLGIHNVAISAPQILATLICSVIFKMLQKPRGVPGDTSVAWTLRFAGVCALGAAWLTRRVGEEDTKALKDTQA